MANCPKCRADGFKSFTFSNGETVTLCAACGDESGHQALKHARKLPWTQEEHEFDELGKHLLPPAELKRQTDLLASGAAEKIHSTEEVCKLGLVWDSARGRHYEREIRYWDVQPLFFMPPDLPVVEGEVSEDRSPADVTTATTPAELKRLSALRKQRKRAWKAAIFRLRLAAWKASIKKLKTDLDSPFCRNQTEKRMRKLVHFWTSRQAFPLPDVPVRSVDRATKVGWLLPKVTCLQPIKINPADERMNRWLAGLDNGKEHESAACGAEEIQHHCGSHCTCDQDWRPHTIWRPWDDPRLHPKDIECLECDFRFLTLRLQRILRWYGSTYSQGQRFREKPIFFQVRADAERRRFQLRSWINGIPQPHRYAKAYECIDFKARTGIKPGQLPHDNYPLMKGSRWKINIDYVIVTRESRREVRIEPPRYKTHDSWREIMAYKGCSRRTAFRLIAEGFRIPECAAAASV